MKFLIEKLGCKVNQFDSFSLEQTLLSNGHERVKDISSADSVVLFGCMVTENAVKQAKQFIRKIQRQNSTVQIYVAGCYARLEADEIKALGVKPLVNWETEFGSEFPLNQPRSRAYLKIQDGCSNRCKYCVIRIARGESKSVEENEVIKNAIRLSKKYSEIILCGIHIGDYGKDFDKNIPLSELLQKLLIKVPNIRFRLSSLHPHEVDEKLISMWGDKRICRHLHLSIQSGSNDVLVRMGRFPARKIVEKIVSQIYKKDSNTFISADLIVGYPFESDKEFSETLAMVKSLPFSWLHVFPFSPRKGTEAERLPTLNTKIVGERADILLNLANERREQFVASNVKKELEVIVTSNDNENEEVVKKDDFVKAISDNYIEMILPNKEYKHKGIAIGEKIKGNYLWGNWK